MAQARYYPDDDVRNLFSKKRKNTDEIAEKKYDKAISVVRHRKKLFEFEGRYEDPEEALMKKLGLKPSPRKSQASELNEELQHAMEIRKKK